MVRTVTALDRVRDASKVKPTKTKAARRIPIKTSLLPLLAAMREEAGGKDARGRVLDMPSIGTMSANLRSYLGRARITRADLFRADAEGLPLSQSCLAH